MVRSKLEYGSSSIVLSGIPNWRKKDVECIEKVQKKAASTRFLYSEITEVGMQDVWQKCYEIYNLNH